jgi:hypothetical protein
MRKSKVTKASGLNTMDIERINSIGNTLADLSARTDALRGYL